MKEQFNTPTGQVVEILLAPAAASAISSRPSVRAFPGRGLEGDRYFDGVGTFSPHPQKPDYEVTCIQQEHIEDFAAACGRPFSSHDARRNIVTRDIDLNRLVGHEFRIGGVLLRGIRLCEPCNHLAKATFPEVLQGLVHKGGLRAQILSEGEIRVGDSVLIGTGAMDHGAGSNSPLSF
jgi:MOSC domain-containing protein YiiM